MKIIMAPVNIAGQPIQIAREMQRIGINARLLQYTSGEGHAFGYEVDKTVNLLPNRRSTMMSTLKECLIEDYDIYHFWLRSLFYGRAYNDFPGMDIPMIKARGKRIIYRFTGFDLRMRSEDMRKNPYSAFHYGYDLGFDESMQKKYLAFLEEYVDEFIVQDPEMQDFLPRAKIIPRVIDIEKWAYEGIKPSNKPLVVHAPSVKKSKGTEFVEKAIDELKNEGLQFEYKPIVGMKNEEAKQWYKKADIIVDQLHVGWYGVLALEGMALGKPVVVYIREELLEKFEHDIPIQNANPETAKSSLRELITDYEMRVDLGNRARKYVEQVHDVRKVVPQLVNVYKGVLQREPVLPKSYSDIDYYSAQIELIYSNRIMTGKEIKNGFVRFMQNDAKTKWILRKLKIWYRKSIHYLVSKVKRAPYADKVYDSASIRWVRKVIKSSMNL
jgi:Glycosyl transferases group 1